MTVTETCRIAKANAYAVAFSTEAEKNRMLESAAEALVASESEILAANEADLKNFKRGEQLRDRLMLNASRIAAIAEGLKQLRALPCPVGETIERHTTASGLEIERVRVPFGTVGIIYEARPNVTADAIGLCIKSGNAVVLRGSGDAYESNLAIVAAIKRALRASGFNPEFIQLVGDRSREGAREFMRCKSLDVLIPRGSASLIQSTLENATVPVIETGTGNCHIYVDKDADINMALNILVNAKTQRIGVCNACESLVIHRNIIGEFLPKAVSALKEHNVEIRGDKEARDISGEIVSATDEDFYTEYLDYIISVRTVGSVEEAIDHINEHNTKHSETIITENYETACKFLDEIDAACVYVNASTRFTDGEEFGFGAEIGISTQKLHARGPMGLRELTTYKYVIYGNGQIRN